MSKTTPQTWQRIEDWLNRPWHSFGDDFYICACADGLHMPVQWVTKSAGFGTQGQARDRIIADHAAATRLADAYAREDALGEALELTCTDTCPECHNSRAGEHYPKCATGTALTTWRERKAREGLIPLDERRHV